MGNNLKGVDCKDYITKELYDKIIGTTTNVTAEPTNTETDNTQGQNNQQDMTRETEYINLNKNAFNTFKGEYLNTNPNASDSDVENAFIQKYQEDFNKYSSSPGTYQSTENAPILAEEINKIKDMFKRLL